MSTQSGVASGATGLGVLFVGATAAAADELDRPFVFFTRDPSAELGGPYYTGFLSLLGVLILWGGAAACGFAGGILRRARDPAASAVIAFAAFSGAVAVDDVFHCMRPSRRACSGSAKKSVETVYLALAVLLVWTYRRFLIDAGWAWPAVTAAVLGAAVSADLVSDLTDANVHVLEDGLKFVGYLTWTGFLTTVAVSKTAGIVRVPGTEPQPARRCTSGSAPRRSEGPAA